MNEIAGWITIGTKLDNKNLEKQLNQQKNQLKKYAQEQEDLMQKKSKAEADLKPYQDEIAALKRQAIESEKVRMTESQRKANYEMLQDQLDDINKRHSKEIAYYEEINKKIAENRNNISTANEQIAKTENLLIEANKKAELKENFEDVKNSIDKASKGMTGIIKKVSRWALAIVGIRGIYAGIRSAMSTISQYDKKLAADLQYIRYALAMSVKPIVEWLVKAIYTILSAVSSLIKSFTGVNIFANASAKNMKSMSKSAKEINKALAPFDEASILGDSSGSVDVSPSFDLSADNLFSDFNLDDFIQKGEKIAEKIAIGINNFFATTDWKGVAEWVSRGLIGIIDILITFITTIDWQKVGNSIATFILNIDWIGLGEKLIELIFKGLIATVELASGAIDGIITAMEDPKFWEKLKGLGTTLLEKIFEGMTKLTDKMGEGLEKLWGKIVDWFLDKLGLDENIKKVAKEIANFIGKVFKTAISIVLGGPIIGGISFLENILGVNDETTKNIGTNLLKGVGAGVKTGIASVLGGPIWGIVTFAKDVLGIHSPSTEFEAIGEYLMLGLKNGLINEEKNVGNEFKKFGSDLIDNLINGIRLRVNSLIDLINSLINKINKSLVFKWNNITIDGVKLLNAGSANVGKIQPIQRFYTGGIVDVPKTGVNIGSVRVGEQGREGIMPFTNPNTMAEVGKEIGKWVTINVDLTNTIDGRILNERLEKIRANNEFSRNGAM